MGDELSQVATFSIGFLILVMVFLIWVSTRKF